MQNWWLSLFCGPYIVCCLLMKSNAIINCVLWPIGGPGDSSWKRPMWRTLLSPIVKLSVLRRRAEEGGVGGGGVLAAIKLLRTQRGNQRSYRHSHEWVSPSWHQEYFRFHTLKKKRERSRDHDDPQRPRASCLLPGAVPSRRGSAPAPHPAVRLPDPLQLPSGGPAAHKPPGRLH